MEKNILDELKRIENYFKSKTKQEIAEIVERNQVTTELECKKTIFFEETNELYKVVLIKDFDQSKNLTNYYITSEGAAA